jgi:hypothetical protein
MKAMLGGVVRHVVFVHVCDGFLHAFVFANLSNHFYQIVILIVQKKCVLIVEFVHKRRFSFWHFDAEIKKASNHVVVGYYIIRMNHISIVD